MDDELRIARQVIVISLRDAEKEQKVNHNIKESRYHQGIAFGVALAMDDCEFHQRCLNWFSCLSNN